MSWENTRSGFVAFALAASLVACDAAPPPQSPADVPVQADGGAVIAAPGRGTPATTPSLEPVKAPGELVAHFRWRSPRATADAVRGLTRMPAGQADRLVQDGVEALLDEAVGEKMDPQRLAEIIDLDAPIDIVLLADMDEGSVPEPLFALSVGLQNLERALSASKGKPEPFGAGMWKIGTADEYGDPCVVAAAAGKAPARLVCGESLEALQKVAPYAARNVASLPDPPQDMRFELQLRPLFDKYGAKWAKELRALPFLAEEFKIGNALFDEALLDAAEAVATEAKHLIHDVDGIRLDAGVSTNGGVDVSVEMRFAGTDSWTAKGTSLAAADRSPAPAMFWNIPAEHAVIGYGHTGDGKHSKPIIDNLQALLEGFLQSEQIGTGGDRAAIVKLLRAPWGDHVAFVSANGPFDTAPLPTGKDPDPQALLEATVGWYLMGFEEAPDRWKAYLAELVRTYNRPTLQSLLKRELGKDAKLLPTVKTVRPPRGFTQAVRFDFTIPPDPPPPPPPAMPGGPPPPPPPRVPPGKMKKVHFEVLLMADGDRTWLGIAADRKPLEKLMAGLKGAPGPDSAAKLAHLQRFKTETHDGVSVTTLAGLLDEFEPILDLAASLAGPSQASAVQQILTSLPNRGASPIVTVVDTTAGAKPRVKSSLNVPAEAIEDITFVVTRAMQMMPGAMAPPPIPPPPGGP